MTYLELCQMLVRECGISGGSNNKPDTVENQTGEMRLVVDWIARADTSIQKKWDDWEFLRRTAHVSVKANSPWADSKNINWPTDLGRWNRYRFHAQAGTSMVRELQYVPWDKYRERFGVREPNPGSSLPSFFTIGNDQSLAFDPPCDHDWVLDAEYYIKRVRMTQDDDVSPIPEQFHDLILYQAMMYYAGYHDAPEVYASAQNQFNDEFKSLESYSLPGAYRVNTYYDEESLTVIPGMTIQTAAVTLQGGLDQVSPQLSIQPGRVVDAQNYELLPRGGCRRTDGFIQYSGGWSPPSGKSLSEFAIVVVSGLAISIDGSAAFVGNQSGAVGYCATHTMRPGTSTLSLDADRDVLAFIMLHGTFQVGDQLESNGLVHAEVVSLGIPENEPTSAAELSKSLISLIMQAYQAEYNAVPGVGDIKALHMFKGYLFAVREDTDGFDHLWSVSDWQGEIHGATPGSWRPAAGQSLTKNGRFEFINYNFAGHANDQVMVGVNGVGQAFYVDESPTDSPTVQFITTGMTHDRPTHVAAFKGHLFLAFPGGSLQHSSIGDLTDWNPVTGAAELTTGEEITALKVLPGNALGIFCKTKILILYGTSASDWRLEVHTDAIGALQGTAQNMAAMTLFADERGITQMFAAQEYGDFGSSMLSHDVDPLYRDTIRKYVASTVNKVKSQYRIFASDGKALFLTFDRNQLSGAMPLDLGLTISCACTGEDTDGNERSFFGGENGIVYELDRGYSFNGQAIEHWIRTPFNHFKSPRQKKFFRKLFLDMDSEANVQLQVGAEFSYGSKAIADHRIAPIEVNEGVQIFENGEGAFSWDYEPVTDGEVFIAGTGVNIGITIYGKSADELPHTLYALIYHYSSRGLKR